MMPDLKLNPPAWRNLIRLTVPLLLAAGQLGGQAVPPVQAAAIHYAKPGGLTTGACDSWGNACELRYALGMAAVAGDEIWVARGIYTPTAGTDRTATFQLKEGVVLYGGFAGTETLRDQRDWGNNVTTLSGNNQSYHVVFSSGLTNAARLDGFTITGGMGTGSGDYSFGGGMFNTGNSRPMLVNLTFSNNAANYGGGMYNKSSSPTLVNVTFSGHNGYVSGAGMYNASSSPSLTEVTFTGGYVNYYGGGMYNDAGSSPSLTRVTFSNNFSEFAGGGLYNTGGNPQLTNVTFSNNTTSYDPEGGIDGGGGMYNADSNPALVNVTFSGNSASEFGGGLYNTGGSPQLTNITFSGNSAATSGGGLYNTGGSPQLTNVTFSGNSADTVGGGIYTVGGNLTVRNTIFVRDPTGDSCSGTFSASSTTNLADDGSCGSSTTVSTNIVLGWLGDYGGSTQTIPLLPGSSAIDAGNAAYCPATDQRGFGRAGRCDIGAFEVQRQTFVPAVLKNHEFFFEGPAEAEDNDAYTSANGPLRSGRTYTGLFNDEKDYFSVRLAATGTITVAVTHTSSGVQLQLFYQVADVAHRMAADTTGRQVTCPNPDHPECGQPGWYYIYLNTGPEPDGYAYTLRATYP